MAFDDDDDDLLRSSLTFMASRFVFFLSLFLLSVNRFQSAPWGMYSCFHAQISLVTAARSKWEATSFCKCMPASTLLTVRIER